MGEMRHQGGPLSGIKVVDLTSLRSSAAQLLSSLGADVIKIESLEGDDLRKVGPTKNPGMGHIFLHTNQGKRSVAVDIKSAHGIKVVHKLISRCDALITNMRSQALVRLGLDYASVKDINKRLIYVNCTGYGSGGPYADKPAYDELIQGAVGIPWMLQQYTKGEPAYAPVTLADKIAGLHAVYAVCAGLYARERTHRGQSVEVPMFESLAQFVLTEHLSGQSYVPSQGEAGYARLLSVDRRPYQTLDGYLCVLMYSDAQWQRFFDLINEAHRMKDDEVFANHQSRSEHVDEVYRLLAGWMKTKTTKAWCELLDAADIPNMPMKTIEDVWQDPHLRATGFVHEVNHPTEGTLRVMRSPTRWSDTPTQDRALPTPNLGQHTQEVLRELGYSETQIRAMMQASAVL